MSPHMPTYVPGPKVRDHQARHGKVWGSGLSLAEEGLVPGRGHQVLACGKGWTPQGHQAVRCGPDPLAVRRHRAGCPAMGSTPQRLRGAAGTTVQEADGAAMGAPGPSSSASSLRVTVWDPGRSPGTEETPVPPPLTLRPRRECRPPVRPSQASSRWPSGRPPAEPSQTRAGPGRPARPLDALCRPSVPSGTSDPRKGPTWPRASPSEQKRGGSHPSPRTSLSRAAGRTCTLPSHEVQFRTFVTPSGDPDKEQVLVGETAGTS